MNKQEYIDYLKETSEKVSPVILEAFKTCEDLNENLFKIIMHFVKRRLNKPLLKPALLRASYEVCGGKEWGKIIPACAAFELINISSYQANSAFDNKLGILTDLQKESQFIASMISREVAFQIIDLMRNDFTNNQLLTIFQCLAESNRYIYIAQHWDVNLLVFSRYEQYKDENKYMEEYIKRCYFGSGIFSGLCAYTGGILAGGTNQQLSTLKSFGEKYGLALHMVNDIGDYVPSILGSHVRRDYQDQLSDFKNGRLTLPLYHFLMHGIPNEVGPILEMLRTKERKNVEEDFIFDLFLSTGSFDFAQNKANQFMGEAKDILGSLEKNYAKDILSVMAGSIRSNKYHYVIRNKRKKVYSISRYANKK